MRFLFRPLTFGSATITVLVAAVSLSACSPAPSVRPGRDSAAPIAAPSGDSVIQGSARTAAPILPEFTLSSGDPITILILYTRRAQEGMATEFGSAHRAAAFAQAPTNMAMYNSLTNASVVIADEVEVSYNDFGRASEEIISALYNGEEGFDDVMTARDSAKADLVILFAEFDDSCGAAWDYAVTSEDAYAVVNWRCLEAEQILAHEIGHLAGCVHDPASETVTPPYGFGYGYCSATFQTIMAVESNSCSSGVIALGYSTPLQEIDGEPTGTEGESDCAQIIRRRAVEMAAFR